MNNSSESNIQNAQILRSQINSQKQSFHQLKQQNSQNLQKQDNEQTNGNNNTDIEQGLYGEKSSQKQNKKNRSLSQLRNFRPAVQKSNIQQVQPLSQNSNNVSAIQQSNGFSSQKQPQTSRNQYIQKSVHKSNSVYQQSYDNQVRNVNQVNNQNQNLNIDGKNRNSNNQDNVSNYQINQQFQAGVTKQSNRGNIKQNNSTDRSHQNLQKQNSQHSTTIKSSVNKSGDMNQFRRSMNRLLQKSTQSNQNSQQNSARVLNPNKIYQNESFSIGENHNKFFNNLSTVLNVQQIDAMQYTKSARKILRGSSAFLNHNNVKSDQQAFLPSLLDNTNIEKYQSEQINSNYINTMKENNFNDHLDVQHSFNQPSNENQLENNQILNQYSKHINQPRHQQYSSRIQALGSSRMNSRSNSKQNINQSNQKQENINQSHNTQYNDQINMNQTNLQSQSVNQQNSTQLNTNQQNLNQQLTNFASASYTNQNQANLKQINEVDKSQIIDKSTVINNQILNSTQNDDLYRKSIQNNSQNNIANSVYNQSNVKAEPRVLSPTKHKGQDVFKIDNRSNSVNNINGNISSNNYSQLNFNQNNNGYYPSLTSRQNNKLLNVNQVNNQNQLFKNQQNKQNIMDDSVEEYLEFNQIPAIDPSKTSQKSLGTITAYGANTHQGIVRNYNEDRVSIILNMAKPKDKTDDSPWPNVSFFAVYDGHGGSSCAEFLRDNLHYYIIRDENFPLNPKEAIIKGFEKIEQTYLEKADSGPYLDKSGSCAIIALIVEKTVYVANVGDSRAILSSNQGKSFEDLSQDHKPSLESEEKRITSLGGHIYQSVIPVYGFINGSSIQQVQEVIKGPHRAFPGRLSVSRTIGDAEAKLSKYGGIKGVISAEPEIQEFNIQDHHDFILLGCDGIFDKMTSQETIQCCWSVQDQCKDQHQFVGKAIENAMRQSMMKNSYDNVTIVIVGLKNIEQIFSKLNS